MLKRDRAGRAAILQQDVILNPTTESLNDRRSLTFKCRHAVRYLVVEKVFAGSAGPSAKAWWPVFVSHVVRDLRVLVHDRLNHPASD